MPYGPFTYLTDLIAQSGGLPNTDVLKAITQTDIDTWDGAAAAVPVIQQELVGVQSLVDAINGEVTP